MLSARPLLEGVLPRYSYVYLSSHNDAAKPLLLDLSLAVPWSGFQRSLDRNVFPVLNLQKTVDERKVSIEIEANQVIAQVQIPRRRT
jgi:hypothetical protein